MIVYAVLEPDADPYCGYSIKALFSLKTYAIVYIASDRFTDYQRGELWIEEFEIDEELEITSIDEKKRENKSI